MQSELQNYTLIILAYYTQITQHGLLCGQWAESFPIQQRYCTAVTVYCWLAVSDKWLPHTSWTLLMAECNVFDSLARGLRRVYWCRTFTGAREHFGHMPILPPLVWLMGTSGIWTRFTGQKSVTFTTQLQLLLHQYCKPHQKRRLRDSELGGYVDVWQSWLLPGN